MSVEFDGFFIPDLLTCIRSVKVFFISTLVPIKFI